MFIGGELWDTLCIEEDLSISSAPETMQIWWERYSTLEEALGELAISKRLNISTPPPAVGILKTPMGSNNGMRSMSDVIVMPGFAVTNGHSPRTVWSPPPPQYVQYVQDLQRVRL